MTPSLPSPKQTRYRLRGGHCLDPAKYLVLPPPPPALPRRSKIRLTRVKPLGVKFKKAWPAEDLIGPPARPWKKSDHYDFYVEEEHDSPLSIEWRSLVADGIGAAHGSEEPDAWIVGQLPRNHTLFTRYYKQAGHPATKETRLYGGFCAYTWAEFIPHANWLLTPAYDNTICQCRPCARLRKMKAQCIKTNHASA